MTQKTYVRSFRPARLLLRRAFANHCPYRWNAAGADADAVSLMGCIGWSCRDVAAAATHAQSGRTYADRHHGLRNPAGVSRIGEARRDRSKTNSTRFSAKANKEFRR